MMKRFLLLIYMTLMVLVGTMAQNSDGMSLRTFGDSIQHVLENTKGVDTTVVKNFITTWAQLNHNQKQIISTQTKHMAHKRYSVQARLSIYYKALIHAFAVEGPTGLTDYLKIAKQVIEYESPLTGGMFFKKAYLFFQQMTVHADRVFQLHVLTDKYKFDYIAKIQPSLPSDFEEDRQDAFSTLEDEELQNEDMQYEEWQDEDMQYEEWQNETELYDVDGAFIDSGDITNSNMPILMTLTPQPELTGPVIRFDRVTFRFSTPYDSVFIKDTKGTLSLTNNIFVGEGGKFDWSSTGLNGDSVYFEFQKYHFDTTNPTVKAEQGLLTHIGKVEGKVEGAFEFRSVSHGTSEKATYPRFTSFNNNIELLGMEAFNLRYVGGFAMNGSRVFSRSINNGYAKLEILGNSGKKLLAHAQTFAFNDSTIISDKTRVTIYQKYDSIYHPSVYFWYNIGSHKLILRKSKDYTKDVGFSMSYFDVDIGIDKLQWDVESDSLFMFVSGGRGQAPMILESADFYDLEDFKILTGYGFNFHPLALMVNYVTKKNIREFYISDIAQKTKKSMDDIHMAMTFLAQKGMVNYDVRNGLVRVKKEALNIFRARQGISDYDNLKIHSVVDGPANAILSLENEEIYVRGVDKFKISDSLNVTIEPDSGTISLQENRTIQFDGRIVAGNFEINGRDFVFKYDSFLISLNHIDSIRLYVVKTNQQGQKIRQRIGNSIEGADSTNVTTSVPNKASGILYINRPNNKSGRTRIPDYPRLDAETGGVIYFDKKKVLNGVYGRSIYYVLPPFKLDSLSNADPATIQFNGQFVSGGMFPPFQQKLHTRSDNSLGFTHLIPDAGYQLFKGDGKVKGVINLSNKGIRVNGGINYLTATLNSENFVFYPDSVVGRGTLGELQRRQIGNVKYPDVSLPQFKLKWLTKQNWFALNSLNAPFDLYKSLVKLDGQLVLSKKGILGSGRLLTHGLEASSDKFTFNSEGFEARDADFRLNTSDSAKPALTGKDIHLTFNLEKNYADISPEIVGNAALEFPYAQFKTSISEARWDLNAKKVVMEKKAKTSLKDSYFYTTREDLDSLNFMATRADYDIETQHLKVSGIPFIQVADAKIIPENNEILILENARIGRLENTSLILDTLNEYHRLINGTIDIISRKQFSGRATYQHVNTENDTFAIRMTDFRVEPIHVKKQNLYKGKNKQSIALEETVASGLVTENDSLILAPRIFYKGNITMYATRPALQLKGSVKLDLKKIQNYNTWIQYEQSGEEDKIFIDFDNAQSKDGKRIGAGLHFDGNQNLYITFAFDKKSPYDEDFFLPSGSLFYDEKSKIFHIEDRLRASGEKLTGKAFTYDESKQEVHFAGPVHFFGKNREQKKFKITASALGSGNFETNDIKMNALLMIDANIPSQALNVMSVDLLEATEQEQLEEGLGDQTDLLYKLANIVGERAIEDFEKQSAQKYIPLTTMPQLLKSLLFSNINLKRTQEHNAFYSTGKLGLSNILHQDINSALDGFMELKTTEDGSRVFHVFFKAASYAWYYLGLEDNRLLIYSSNDEFNDIISKKTNASKTKIGKLTFALGSTEETLAFINRFRKEYYNIETPFQLEGGVLGQAEETEDGEDDGF